MKKDLSLQQHSLINLVVTYLGFFIAFFNTFFRTQVITPEEIGLVSLILSIALYLRYFIELGATNAILKFMPLYNKQESSGLFVVIVLFSVFMSLFLSLLLVIFKSNLLQLVDNRLFNEYFYYIFVFSILGVLFSLVEKTLEIYYRSVVSNFVGQIVSGSLHLTILVVMMVFEFGFRFYIIAYTLIHVFRFLLIFIYLIRKKCIGKPTFHFFEKKTVKSISTYSLFMFSSGIAGVVTTNIDMLMISAFLSLKEVGVYSIAVSISNVIGMIGSSMSRVTHSKISNDFSKNNHAEIERDYKEVGEFQFCVAIFVFVILCYLGPSLLTLLGNDYVSGFSVVLLISASQVIDLGTSTCGGILSLSAHFRADLYCRFFLMGLNIILNYFMIGHWGIVGAAISSAISLLMYNAIKVVLVYHWFKVIPFTFSYIKVVISTVPLVIFFEFIEALSDSHSIIQMLLAGAAAFGIYCAMLLRVGFDNPYFKVYEKLLCRK